LRKTKDSDEFLTPQPLADLVKKVLGDVYFDPFGSAKQLVRTRTMHTIETGNQPWPAVGPQFANPPFSQLKEQVPRFARWQAEHGLDALMLCIAAPGSLYWREAIWSKTGPQRVAWLPRVSFMRFSEDREVVEYRRIDNDRLVKPAVYRKFVRDQKHEALANIRSQMVANPNFGKVAPTEHTISYDTALMLWSTNPVVIARFVREVTTYAKEANPKAAPIGISLGGGPQP
jgi:hypothetical protein